MFILRIGAEALKISDNKLSDDFRHSTIDKFKSARNTMRQKYSTNNQSILYNLLKQRNITQLPQEQSKNRELSNSFKSFNERSNSSNIESTKPISVKMLTSRPSSAPQSVRFHPYKKSKLVLVNKNKEHTIKIYPEKLILQWLKNIVSIMKPELNGENSLWKVLNLSDLNRKKILKQSWHLIFITYLVEYVQTNDEKMEAMLGLLIKDYDKTFDNNNYKKLFRLTRVFTNDLEAVIVQMVELNLNQSLFQLLRVAILFTDRQEDKELKNMELLKPLLLCHSKEYYDQFDDVVQNLFKLDVVMAESMFCGHLTQSVDNIIDEIYAQS